MMGQDFEAMAKELEATGDYRVLRRLRPRRHLIANDGSPTRCGMFLDLETTGLDPETHEIIELAMVPFSYGLDGRIFEIEDGYSGLCQPSHPIPRDVVRLTGITDEMVEGKSIDPADVARFLSDADIVIAHNAEFDRRFAEKFSPSFASKPWACSMTQVGWAAEGFDGRRLGQLLSGFGLWHNGHRALDDCLAGIEILAHRLPVSGVPAMAKLLDAARQVSCRIWAEGAPFESKDMLKGRGYRWSDGSDGRPKAWFIDVPETQAEAEIEYLRREIYRRHVSPTMAMVDARDRFSARY